MNKFNIIALSGLLLLSCVSCGNPTEVISNRSENPISECGSDTNSNEESLFSENDKETESSQEPEPYKVKVNETWYSKSGDYSLMAQQYDLITLDISIYFAIPQDYWNFAGADVSLDYDAEVFDLIDTKSQERGHYVYYVVPMTIAQNKRIEIFYENTKYTFDISIEEHDFVDSDKPSSETLEEKYTYFKHMLDSIQYHTYTTPYPGCEDYDYTYCDVEYSASAYTYRKTYSDKETYDTSYLPLLKDDVYYPATFEWSPGKDNPYGVRFVMGSRKDFEPDSDKSTMSRFSVTYNSSHYVDSLISMKFIANPFSSIFHDPFMEVTRKTRMHDQYYLLGKAYPEYFTQYSVGNVTVSLIEENNELYGYFEDENYQYSLYARYAFTSEEAGELENP